MDTRRLFWHVHTLRGCSGPGKGEWFMENQGLTEEEYFQYATDKENSEYFRTAAFNPSYWAELAKKASMKWMCLTPRHHDGFCLFDSPHPNSITSVQTLGRDLLAEYVEAVRASGLKVGFYYSPFNWRDPGFFDVTGENIKANKFGYQQDPSNKESARVMREENYVSVRKLQTYYGRIDYIFGDGGWLAQEGSDADGAFFTNPGSILIVETNGRYQSDCEGRKP
ncbi:alpha-L-fucosidase [Pelagicoccus sp. SDUM812002]|uniref:alpha-L-fucosidase n=1 Tax=Pelagicoccus sp. SDUM812002 TaxID=3041266 RepID=UPI00280D8C50|nr:alpha-L-fucosidase [Pelagicoccus sp. SDUM812002]MDQ8184183.1 alpha-L-fucosidase [Pelagicoccus sp. SDUM812002]